MRRVVVCLFILCLASLLSCKGNDYKVNIENINLNLEFINLDSILYASKGQTAIVRKNELLKKDADLLNYTVGYCYHISSSSDTAYMNGLTLFYTDQYIQRLEKVIANKFSSKERKETEISDAFKRLKFHFPINKFPKRIAYINSLFSASVNCSDNFVAIGLDRYLGKDENVIKELPSNQFYQWIKEGMDKRYLTRDVLLSWLMAHYINETSENYSSEMIRWGKLLFITHACLPDLEDPIIVRYSKKDYDWAINSEGSFWKYLVEEELLFNTMEETKQNLLHEGPFSTGLPQESPDRMGQFLGYQMVKQYMDEESISLKELVKVPYNTILQSYKPN